MTLFDRYIKSATYGASYTQRFRRVLLFFCIIIWLFGIIGVYEPVKEGVIGLSEYFKEKNLIENMNSTYDKYELAKIYLQEQHPDDTLTESELEIIGNKNKPLPAWLESGAASIKRQDDIIDATNLTNLKKQIWGLIAIPSYFLLFFVLPWLFVKLIFWIKTADNVKKI